MMKVYSNIIPWKGFLAMTIWPLMFIRKAHRWQFNATDENHETIHAHQQKEVLLTSVVLLLVMIVIFGLSWWWLMVSPLVFFLWYVIEYLVRCIIYGSTKQGYRNISFEQEAFMHEKDFSYLPQRKFFAWIKYLTKKTYRK